MRNKRYLQDIVKGCYGRKIAYTNVSKITPDNIVSVVGSCIGCFNYNKTVIEYLNLITPYLMQKYLSGTDN